MTGAALLLAVDESKVNPGVLGFVVIACLGVATFLLIKSMNRQMKKIDFDDGSDQEQQERQQDGPAAPSG